MKEIKKYVAIDNKEFYTESDCLKYEGIIYGVNSIMEELPRLPENDGCSFVNGRGYIQHDLITLTSVKKKLLHLISVHIDHPTIKKTLENTEAFHHSHITRLLGDYGITPFYNAWHRFICIDTDLREWGQPYFAIHPEKAEGKHRIND